MKPPISTTLALVEDSLRPLGAELSPIKSYAGHVVFVRDKHYRNLAGAVASHVPKIGSKRLQFARDAIYGRAVDLTASTLGETFTSKVVKLQPSQMNPSHLVWGTFFTLPDQNEAVLQIAFERIAGAPPSEARIAEIYANHEEAITHSLQDLAIADTPTIIEACKLDASATPNAFALKWDVMDSSHLARTNYGELRHFITTFEYTIAPIVSYYGGHISSYGGDSQDIVIPIPTSINRNSQKELKKFAQQTIKPLLDKIEIAHTSLSINYQPNIRIRLGIGIGAVETTLAGEETGPVLWDIASQMKMRAGSSELFTLCLDDSIKDLL